MPARRRIDIPTKYVTALRTQGWSLAELRLLSDVLYAFRWLVQSKRIGDLHLDDSLWTRQFGLDDQCGYFSIYQMRRSWRFKQSGLSRTTYALRWLCRWGIVVSHRKHIPLQFRRATGKRPEHVVFISRDFSKLDIDAATRLQDEWLKYWSSNSEISSLSKIITWFSDSTSFEYT